MEKLIPYEKLSKKKKRALDAMKRNRWNGMSPVTRKTKNKKLYNRKAAQSWKEESNLVPLFF